MKKKEIIIIIKGRRGPRLGQVRGHAARISVRPEDMQQDKHQGPWTLMCPFESLRKGPWLTYEKAKVYVQISSKKAIKNPTKLGIIFVTHGSSPWDPEWIIREKWFSR